MLKKKIKGGLPSQLISRRARLALLAAVTALAATSQLMAATVTWMGGTGNFVDGTHWTGGGAIVYGSAFFVNSSDAEVAINSVFPATAGSLTVWNGAVTVEAGANATINTISMSNNVGSAPFSMTGGIIRTSYLGVGSNNNANQQVVFNMNGGALTATSVAIGGFGRSDGTVNLTDSGVINADASGTGTVSLSRGGVLNLGTGGNAGTLNAGLIQSTSLVGTLNLNHSNAVTVSAVIGTGITVNKLGSGVATLTGTNSYTDSTGVFAGTLLVNNASGSGTGTSSVSVADLAILGGSGNIGGNIVAAGILAPGSLNAIGTLSVGGSVTWNGAAADAWQFDLGASGVSDKLAIAGALTKGTGSVYAFDFLGGGSIGSYTLATFGSSTFSSSDFTVKNLASGLTATFTKSATDLTMAVVATPVPEPATFAALAGAVVLGFVVVRRRKTVAA